MQTTEFIWQNGNFIPWADAKVHILTHTLHYSGGAFEGIRFYETEKGPAIFRLGEHIDRLFYSAGVLKMSLPYTKAEIIDALTQLVRMNTIQAGYIRPLVFYGYGKMGVNPVGSPVECAIACWPWGAYLPHESVDVQISRYIRIHPDSTVVDAKLCGHYLNGILASLALQGTHYHEALLLDAKGFISEGVGENIFIVKDKVLYTPKLGTILAGITRETIFTLAARMGIKIVEADLTPQAVYAADEAFFTGTAVEVTPVRSVDDHIFNQGNIGPITTAIKAAYQEVVHGRDPAFVQYLTYVQS